MTDEWKVFERCGMYQIGRYYFGIFHIQKIEWYMERYLANYGGSSVESIWSTSTKELAVSYAKQINVALFNAEARLKVFDKDYWKEIT